LITGSFGIHFTFESQDFSMGTSCDSHTAILHRDEMIVTFWLKFQYQQVSVLIWQWLSTSILQLSQTLLF